MKKFPSKQVIIYQTKSGAIAFRGDFKQETIWGTQKQIAEIFGVDVRTINEHLKNIYKTKELSKTSTIRKFRTVQKEGSRKVSREINFYNLDTIISVGYRVSSAQATQFRIWANKVLKQYILQGFALDKKRIGQNYETFLQAVENVKVLLPKNNKLTAEDVLELVKAFANTWFSLEAYDKGRLPKKGVNKKQIAFTAEELTQALEEFKKDLINKKQATNLFGVEKEPGALEGIVGNILQSVFGKNVYPTMEEKAAHLLYFMIKNHPFTDGNKRSGAFSFVWFLRRAGLLRASFTPEALTALSLLIAESNSKDKEKMIGLVLLFLRGKYE